MRHQLNPADKIPYSISPAMLEIMSQRASDVESAETMVFDMEADRSGAGSGIRLVNNPMVCLYEAYSRRPDLIAIRFSPDSIEKRKTAFELALVLKLSPNGNSTKILALLPEWNRRMVEMALQVGADLVGLARLDTCSGDLDGKWLAERKNKAVAPRTALDRICPYLNHSFTRGAKELATCLAHYNRLTPTAAFKEAYCHCRSHQECGRFRNPQFKIN